MQSHQVPATVVVCLLVSAAGPVETSHFLVEAGSSSIRSSLAVALLGMQRVFGYLDGRFLVEGVEACCRIVG